MKRYFIYILLLVFNCLSLQVSGTATDQSVSSGGTVFVLPVEGAIDKGMLMVFRRAFREAAALGPRAIILEIDTPGGGLNETREIIDWVRASKKGGCPVYAYVRQDALSAGALLCLSSSGIYMSESAIIGSAMPIVLSPLGGGVQELPADVKEKMLSMVRAMVVSLAQENGYREEVAVAMVDPNHPGVKDGDEVVCPQGQLLNFTARNATKVSSADGQPMLAKGIVSSLEEVLEAVGMSDVRVQRFEQEGADILARLITAIGPLLLGLGILALWIEFKTPGFGVFGITGIVLLLIYFFGHYVAGLAGVEEVALVLLGVVLLAVEIFLIPGFGVTGVVGILCILLGAGLAVIPQLPAVAPLPDVEPISVLNYLAEAMRSLLFTLLVCFGGIWLLGRYLPKSSFYQKLVVADGLAAGAGYDCSAEQTRQSLLGQCGRSMTVLRPSGTALFSGKRVDVVADGEFIGKGCEVEVIAVDGTAVVVRAKALPSEDA
jgi:membrane-bound serine protease (ClpP class)